MDDDRLAQIHAFLGLCDRLKTIERGAYVSGQDRHENDAEHSWHMALFCLVLHRALGLTCDLGRVLEMVLCHDLVEILAGDVNVYDAAGREAAKAREAQAAIDLFGPLPPPLDRHLTELWEEFEAGQTPEAQFAGAVDRLQAMNQNYLTAGRGWREHGVTEAMSRRVNVVAAEACPALRPLFETIWDGAAAQGMWVEDET